MDGSEAKGARGTKQRPKRVQQKRDSRGAKRRGERRTEYIDSAVGPPGRQSAGRRKQAPGTVGSADVVSQNEVAKRASRSKSISSEASPPSKATGRRGSGSREEIPSDCFESKHFELNGLDE